MFSMRRLSEKWSASARLATSVKVGGAAPAPRAVLRPPGGGGRVLRRDPLVRIREEERHVAPPDAFEGGDDGKAFGPLLRARFAADARRVHEPEDLPTVRDDGVYRVAG